MSVRVHSICTNLPSRFLTHAQDVCAYEINIDRLFLHHRGDSRSFERSGCLCVCECVCAYAWLGAPFINKSWVISYLSLFTYKHFLLIHCTISPGAHCPTWICIIHSALYFGVLWSQRQTVRELRVRHLHLSTKHRGGIQEDKTFYEQETAFFFFFLFLIIISK